MKKYDRIRTLPLVEVFNSYIEHNGLSLTQYLTVVDITISIESTDAILRCQTLSKMRGLRNSY